LVKVTLCRPYKCPFLRLSGGVTRTVSSWGSSISSYGEAAKSATAATTPSYKTATTIRKSDTSKKEKVPEKKELQKALPSGKPMKALPAPPRMSRRSSSDSVISKATSAAKKPYDPTHSTYKPSGSLYSAGANKKPDQNKKHADAKVRISPESRPGRTKITPGAPLTASNLKTVPAAPSVARTSVGSSVTPSIPGRHPGGKIKISAESRPKPA
jgi:hypothetical protein